MHPFSGSAGRGRASRRGFVPDSSLTDVGISFSYRPEENFLKNVDAMPLTTYSILLQCASVNLRYQSNFLRMSERSYIVRIYFNLRELPLTLKRQAPWPMWATPHPLLGPSLPL
jgi:hypothetical protein